MGRAQRIMLTGIGLWVFFMATSLSAAIESKKSDNLSISTKQSKLDSSNSESTTLNQANKIEEETAANDDLYWLCRNALEVRTVRLEQKAESCVTYYTKQGRDEEVLRAKKVKNCAPMVSKVKSNLEKGGWICKNISDSSITK